MVKEKMTVHEALCAVKLAEKRLGSKLGKIEFAVAEKPGRKINGKEPKEFSEQVKKEYQSIVDTMKRVEALKKAISQSNALTNVEINGKTYTVASAIYMWKYEIPQKEVFLNQLKVNLSIVKQELDEDKKNLDNRLDKYLVGMFGNKEKTKSEEAEQASKFFIEHNQKVMIDPLNIQEVINNLEEEITSFKEKVDSALQVSNALTTIEIEY